MTHSVLAFAVFAWGLTAPALAPQAPARQTPPARASDAGRISVVASVVDSRGEPVTGLTTADFLVREDGVAREVLAVSPATEPMQIALLADDSQAAASAIQPMREGLKGFVEALEGQAQIALITFGERPTQVVPYTTSREELAKGIDRIFARPSSGSYLLEAIPEASQGLQRRSASRPVIVVLMIEAVEFGSGHHDQILKTLYESGATLHVLAVGTPSTMGSEEIRNRNVVISEGTERTGGRRDQLLSPQAIPGRLKQLAAELLNQYVVTYARPDALIPPERVRVSVTRPDLRVRASTEPAAGR